MLNEGQVIEQGKHDELLAARAFYHDLYMSQFRYGAALPSDDGREPKTAVAEPADVAGGK